MVPGKDLSPGGAVPGEPVAILLCQLSCSTGVEDILVETACAANISVNNITVMCMKKVRMHG